MNDDILDGLEDVLDGIDAEIAEPTPLPAPKKARAKKSVPVTVEGPLPQPVGPPFPPTTPYPVGPPFPPTTPYPTPAALESDSTLDHRLKHFGFSGKRVRIVVERSHDPADLPTVFLKLNDYTCRITRGEEVAVPEEMLGVLNDAVQTAFSQPTDGVLIPHDSLRFPYRVIR